MRRGEQRLEAISAMDRTIINNGRNYTQKEEQEVEAISHLLEEITVLLSQWNGLQMAVENQWGGRDSVQKAHQLAVDVLSWFSQSKGQFFFSFPPCFNLCNVDYSYVSCCFCSAALCR